MKGAGHAMRKRILSVLLCLCMVLGVLPIATITALAVSATPDASGPETIAQLQARFPAGKYWNHVGTDNWNNPHGYNPLNLPCNHHGNCGFYPDQCECNSFDGAIQCMGFAYRLGYGYYRTSVRNWSQEDNGDLNSLKAGDVVDFGWSGYGINRIYGHTIWITNVQGNTITYADCNSGNTCIIRWNVTDNKYSVITGNYTIHHAPYAATGSSSTPSQPTYYATTQNLGEDFYAYIYNPQSGCNVANYNGNAQTAAANSSDLRQIWHFVRKDETSYNIINMYDGNCLDAWNFGTTNGTNIQVIPLDKDHPENTAQRWRCYGLNNAGPYYISPFYFTYHDLVMDVNYGSTAPGANIQLYENWYKGHNEFVGSQTFQVKKISDSSLITILSDYLGSDFYAHISYSGKYFESTASTDGQSTNVQISSLNSADPKQIWHFIRQSNGSYKVVNEYNGWYLDLYGGIAANTKNVGTWYDDHGRDSELWHILRAKDTDRYTILTSVLFPQYAIDIPEGNTSIGTNVEIFQRHWGTNQEFTISPIIYTKPARPADPQNLRVSATASGTTVAWDAVPISNAYDDRSYEVSIHKKDGSTLTESRILHATVTGTSYTSSLVLPEGEYYAMVRSLNTKYSSFSDNYKSIYNIIDLSITQTCTVSVSATEGGTVSGGGTYNRGDYTTLQAKPNKGWRFAGWVRNGEPVTDWAADNPAVANFGLTVTGDETFEALFERIEEPASLEISLQGSAAAVSVHTSQTQTVDRVAVAAYTFTGVMLDIQVLTDASRTAADEQTYLFDGLPLDRADYITAFALDGELAPLCPSGKFVLFS